MYKPVKWRSLPIVLVAVTMLGDFDPVGCLMRPAHSTFGTVVFITCAFSLLILAFPTKIEEDADH
jgi:hypothetical protein